jgi:hypothetical protein
MRLRSQHPGQGLLGHLVQLPHRHLVPGRDALHRLRDGGAQRLVASPGATVSIVIRPLRFHAPESPQEV